MIRLSALETVRVEFRRFCWSTLPLLCVARWFSSHPLDWCLLWLGWKLLHGSYGWASKRRNEYFNIEPKHLDEQENPAPTTLHNQHGTDVMTRSMFPSAVAGHISSFLVPEDVVKLACLNKEAKLQFNSDEIWKLLWYRDYGTVLLRWQVGREVLESSLDQIGVNNQGSSLEYRLAQRLEQLSRRNTGFGNKSSLKEFYFVFGEVYLDYLLAKRNKLPSNNCLLGLHGHIFDFTPFAQFHPGLIEPVLLDCGGNATESFEDLPHSRGARAMARKLAVVVNRSAIPGAGCGFILTPPLSKHHLQALQRSNTQPPADLSLWESSNKTWADTVLTKKSQGSMQRPLTLARIRRKWDLERKKMQDLVRAPFWQTKDCRWRLYYDPLLQEWHKWDPSDRE